MPEELKLVQPVGASQRLVEDWNSAIEVGAVGTRAGAYAAAHLAQVGRRHGHDHVAGDGHRGEGDLVGWLGLWLWLWWELNKWMCACVARFRHSGRVGSNEVQGRDIEISLLFLRGGFVATFYFSTAKALVLMPPYLTLGEEQRLENMQSWGHSCGAGILVVRQELVASPLAQTALRWLHQARIYS